MTFDEWMNTDAGLDALSKAVVNPETGLRDAWNAAIRACASLLEDGDVPYDGDEPSPFDFARVIHKWQSEPPR